MSVTRGTTDGIQRGVTVGAAAEVAVVLVAGGAAVVGGRGRSRGCCCCWWAVEAGPLACAFSLLPRKVIVAVSAVVQLSVVVRSPVRCCVVLGCGGRGGGRALSGGHCVGGPVCGVLSAAGRRGNPLSGCRIWGRGWGGMGSKGSAERQWTLQARLSGVTVARPRRSSGLGTGCARETEGSTMR